MKTFELHRDADATGISGTGIVAEGVIFEDGTVALRWKTAHKSTTIYADIGTLRAIHGHEGQTRIVYTGNAYIRGRHEAMQDRCENVPFAGIGGIAFFFFRLGRRSMT